MIYLDSAATTLQKPPAVARASAAAVNHLASPGRGGHRAAMEAGRVAFACREEAAALFHVPSPEQVVFTSNATHGLNIAIRTLIKPGSRVVISGWEHNAVTRPLRAVPDVTVRVAKAPLFDRATTLEAFRQELELGADVVICTHVSNVFGFILPIEEIANLCRSHEVPLIVDASQSAGCLEIDVQALGSAFVAMPGHKGLYGPQGTGLLLCGAVPPEPILRGGTGSESLRQEMPDFLPDRLEAGTHNMVGISGLLEGLRFVRRQGIETIAAHEQRLVRQMGEQISKIPGAEVFFDETGAAQAAVLSFRLTEWECESLGQALSEKGIAVRAGLHCAPLAHRTAETLESGTVRASVSVFNQPWEIKRFSRVLRQFAEEKRK